MQIDLRKLSMLPRTRRRAWLRSVDPLRGPIRTASHLQVYLPHRREAGHAIRAPKLTAHASSQSVLPILSRLQARPNLAAAAIISLRPAPLRLPIQFAFKPRPILRRSPCSPSSSQGGGGVIHLHRAGPLTARTDLAESKVRGKGTIGRAMIEHLRGRERALEPLGWTGREAEWIALVCLHSGVFIRPQFCDYFETDRKQALRVVRALVERGSAVESEWPLVSTGR